MALPVLPAEYRALHIARFKHCFGHYPVAEQERLLEILIKINKLTGINTQ